MKNVFAKIRRPVLLGSASLAAAFFCGWRHMASEFTTFDVYGPGMVLQRGKPVVFRGLANPGDWLNVSFRGITRSVQTAPDGIWRAEFPAMQAGGPWIVRITGAPGAPVITYDDVLIGDVWVKAGKSGTSAAVPSAGKDLSFVRMTRPLVSNTLLPQTNSGAVWEHADAAGAAGIPLEKGVPAGIVQVTAPPEKTVLWISHEGLKSGRRTAELADRERILKAFVSKISAGPVQRRTSRSQAYLDAFFAHGKNAPSTAKWKLPGFHDKDWTISPDHRVPAGLDGVFWFRKSVVIPDGWAGLNLKLQLGVIADCDETFYNGVPVGSTPCDVMEFNLQPRVYPIPGPLVKPGPAVIAVRVTDFYGVGGLYAPAGLKLMRYETKSSMLSLDGPWKMKAEFLVRNAKKPPFVLPNLPDLPASLFNGAIAPWTAYPVRGVVWNPPERNPELDSLLRRDWRNQWSDNTLEFHPVR